MSKKTEALAIHFREVEKGFALPGSEVEARAEMPNYPECPVAFQAEALKLAQFVIFYMSLHLNWNAKDGSLAGTLAQLGLSFLERMPQLATLAALDGKELPKL